MFKYTRAQIGLVSLFVAMAVGSVAYRIIAMHHLEQTSLLFIGVPALLGIFLAMTPASKTAKGSVIKGITLFLLLSGVLLGEGFICILMASPIFLLVGIIIVAVVDYCRERKRTLSCLAIIFVPLSMEGTSPRLSFSRDETVQVSRVIDASVDDVASAISRSPRLDVPIPAFGRLGFPKPVEAHGFGLAPGATRTIHFAGGEGNPGDLTLRVVESSPGRVRFIVENDASKIAHWMEWRASETNWTRIDNEHTLVIWTLSFRRLLDPAVYFRPLERYAVRLAAAYLIEANAVPTTSERTK